MPNSVIRNSLFWSFFCCLRLRLLVQLCWQFKFLELLTVAKHIWNRICCKRLLIPSSCTLIPWFILRIRRFLLGPFFTRDGRVSLTKSLQGGGWWVCYSPNEERRSWRMSRFMCISIDIDLNCTIIYGFDSSAVLKILYLRRMSTGHHVT